jgi:CDP-diacylglycerol---glycerol-3-phosphate 3-phosphatidyltransferase
LAVFSIVLAVPKWENKDSSEIIKGIFKALNEGKPPMTTQPQQPTLFTDLLRRRLSGVIRPTARFLLRLGLTPNMVTVCGLAGHIIAAILIVNGSITLGGLLLLLFAPLDALDGAMARELGKTTRFGSFLDSVTDRYAELILWGGLLIHYMQLQDGLTCLVIYAAAAGSVLVPYIRAKAESLGSTAKIGLLSRVERYLILIPLLIFNLAIVAIWAIAILANVTAIQRIIYFRGEAEKTPQQNE